MAFVLTRIDVSDYDRWKPMFQQDTPGARTEATGHRPAATRTPPTKCS